MPAQEKVEAAGACVYRRFQPLQLPVQQPGVHVRLGTLPESMERGLPGSGGRSFWQDSGVVGFSMALYPGQPLAPMLNLNQCCTGRPCSGLNSETLVSCLESCRLGAGIHLDRRNCTRVGPWRGLRHERITAARVATQPGAFGGYRP